MNTNIKMITEKLECGHPVVPEVRDAFRKIVKFYNSHKHRHNRDFLLKPSQQQQIVQLSKVLQRYRRLKINWDASLEQDIEATYHVKFERVLKKVLNNYKDK